MAEQRGNKPVSQPQAFTGGMVSDANPRFQPKGSYRDALNIRIINDEGNTFSVENIEGNKKFLDLTDIDIFKDPKTLDSNNNEVGPGTPTGGLSTFNSHDASIVGHYSYSSNVIFIVLKTVSNYDWDAVTETIFLDVKFNANLEVESVTDLYVCYDHQNVSRYPRLNMRLDHPVRVEGLIENECISRIYWTDNINPLRSLNINQRGKNLLSPDVLDLTPMHSPSQPVIERTLSGSLPIGKIQYCYKYVSRNGGESVMSPFSNLYHTTNKSGTYSGFYGAPSGDPAVDVGAQGFEITIYDLDDSFDAIELYAILHEQNNGGIRVAFVSVQNYQPNSTEVTFSHTNWSGDLENGIDAILIENNTWDVTKDIAIKDNILFAGNLRTRDNSISEREWNVKVRRYNVVEPSGSGNVGRITTTDSDIKEYQKTSGVVTEVTPSLGQTWDDGSPKWRTYKGQGSISTNSNIRDDGRVDVQKKQSHEFRYLSDGITLGAESYNYDSNELGGCRITFGIRERELDSQNNTNKIPFINAGSYQDIQTDNITDGGTNNTDNVYQSSINLGGSKDPAIGDRVGYRRGELYRFGVQIYDKKGRPGNVLWIGDIEMPEQYDPLRMLRTNASTYSPDLSTSDLLSNSLLKSSKYAQDHRTSFIYGSVVPGCEVAWLTKANNYTKRFQTPGAQLTYGTNYNDINISPNTITNSGGGVDLHETYVNLNGSSTHGDISVPTPKTIAAQASVSNSARPKEFTFRQSMTGHDDTHYALDLYVNFEFRIPEDVRDKISGFRVVRAERTSSDKSIIQQGILNQTIAYGHTKLSRGYDQMSKIKSEHHADGTDAIANDDNSEPTKHLNYDSYLNGYIGLAENSNYARQEVNYSEGTKLITGADQDNNVFGKSDYEEASVHGTGGAMVYHRDSDYTKFNSGDTRTPGTQHKQRRHSAYFGSYEVIPNTDYQKVLNLEAGVDGTGNTTTYPEHVSQGGISLPVQGSIFTLDSPDSAFGMNPYNYRSGDQIRIDAVMKLVYDNRTDSNQQNNAGGTYPFGYRNHSGNNVPESSPTDPSPPPSSFTGPNIDVVQDDALTTVSGSAEHDEHDLKVTGRTSAIKYSDMRSEDGREKNFALYGKYYIYDTYYGIGMSVDGGNIYTSGAHASSATSRGDTGYRPSQHHDKYTLDILAAKEIGDGEILSNSYFKSGVSGFDLGRLSGFSNNTLGYCQWGRKLQNENSLSFLDGSYKTAGWSVKFAHIYGNLTTPPSDVKNADYTYDTMSTIQQGLRSIVLQIDGDGGHTGNKRGLLNPRNLSAVLENRNWHSRGTDGQNSTATIEKPTLWQSALGNPNGNANELKGEYGNRSYIPFKFLCSIVRNVTPYGGDSKSAIENTRFIPCGNFHPITKDSSGSSDEAHLSSVYGGDTYITFYTHQKTACVYEGNSAARWQIFPVESETNTDMRMGRHLSAGDVNTGNESTSDGQFVTNEWQYNDVYSQQNNLKSAIMVNEDEICKSLDLRYEIAYSNTKISGEKEDSFRVFEWANFHDMESSYGEITRLVNFRNELYVLQESSISKLLVNPISMIKDDLGTTINVGTGDTIENHLYISTKFGTRHMDSVVASQNNLYFVDNNYGKLLAFNGESLNILSDTLGQRDFFKKTITDNNLGSSVIPGYGALADTDKFGRNFFCDNHLKYNGITSAFDYKNNELIITLHSSTLEKDNTNARYTSRKTSYDNLGDQHTFNTKSKTIVFSEALNAFSSYYSHTPRKWYEIGGYLVTAKANVSLVDNAANALGVYDKDFLSLWKWDDHVSDYKTLFFEDTDTTKVEESYILKTIAEAPQISKVFDNCRIIMIGTNQTIDDSTIDFNTEITAQQLILGTDTSVKYREGVLRFPLRQAQRNLPRMRGTYVNIKYSTKSTEKFNIFAILAKYRQSFN